GGGGDPDRHAAREDDDGRRRPHGARARAGGAARVAQALRTRMKPPFKFSATTRVAFSDTDAQGIVYYGRYLPYFDMARVEYHRHLEMLPREAPKQQFVMRACSIDFFAPARFDDLIEVYIRVSRIGRTTATYEGPAYRVDDDALMVTARQTLVLVDLAERTPHPIPDWFRERIRSFEGEDLELAAGAATA